MKLVTGNQLREALGTEKAVQQKQVISLTSQVMDSFFNSLKAIYPAWRNAYPTQELERLAKLTWLKAFSENGINTHEQLSRGLKVARQSSNPFMPSVGQFISWVKDSDLISQFNLPTPERLNFLYSKILELGTDSETIIKFTEKNGLNKYEYHLLYDLAIKKPLESDREILIEKLIKDIALKLKQGERYSEPLIAIEKKEPQQATPEVINEGVSILRKAMRGVA